MLVQKMVIAVVLLTATMSECRKVTVSVKGRWTFIDKFVFDERDSKLGNAPPLLEFYTKDAPKDGYRLVLYSDQPYSWPAAKGYIRDDELWKNDELGACEILSTCPSTTNCSTCMLRSCNGAIPIAATCDDPKSHCIGTKANPYRQLIEQHTRPRFWFIGVTNCEVNKTPLLQTKIYVTFRNPGGWFREEFGVDEQGILEFQIIIVPYFAIMAGAYAGMTYRERKRQGDAAEIHAVIKWFLLIIALQLIYYTDKLKTYSFVATYGEGYQYFSSAGFLASVMFIMLVVNFSTGFSAIGTQFFAPLKDSFHQKAIAGMGLFLILWNCVLFVYSRLNEDPMDVESPYQTWPSILLSTARVPIIGYYMWCLYNTVQEVPEQKKYYVKWGAVFFSYLCALPLFTVLASVVSPHVKFRAVDCTVDVVTVVSMSCMCYLLWPGPGLTNVLSNTYTLSATGPTHMPMSDGGALSPPPPPISNTVSSMHHVDGDDGVGEGEVPLVNDDTREGGLEVTINEADDLEGDGANPLRPLVAS
eukprot:TRINITY_DN3327_c1_g1_i1.p1 TRINITY_DN3327_c1_g1~~TRINITY_DN3327_c1_g1_i1.p1  ORF type:complete len:548 (+),score=115.85 TRINITY_DN3327_c1_g1_i1:60-1646(+)